MPTRLRLPALLAFVVLCAACAAPTPGGSAAPEYHQPPKNAFETAYSHQPGVTPIRWAGWMKTLLPGDGPRPTPDSIVTVNYRGTLTDGTEFDSSYKRGKPTTFALSGVIPCWTDAVSMMRVGGKAELVCPASSAYGDAGSPPLIPGGATLVFQIELLSVK